ncbi:diguanylate cyclase [Brevibacillus ginsengisoli]|uniref:GGDEF domain-containing protein n=1 Tax=Brevibacillus ginsengisoli TaxID=363854 RepID=UPI003CEA515D
MEHDSTHQPPSQRCMTLTHHAFGTRIHFHKKTWKYFHQSLMIDRLNKWQQVASGENFRQLIEWSVDGDNLYASLPPVPEKYLPLSYINNVELDNLAKIKIIISLTDALAKLHKNQFFMGFLSPELIYFHPQNHTVILDVQPYPSAYPFVNNLLDDFPYILFSSYSRKHEMTRVCDFYSIGMMIQWVCGGRLPDKHRMVSGTLPQNIHVLCHRLIVMPESFISVEEIMADLLALLDQPSHAINDFHIETDVKWLHPMVPPIDRRSQQALRSFLRSEGLQVMGIICEDEVTRLNVLRHHVMEVLEYHFFFTIRCKNLPFSTLRESIERTLYTAYRYLPETSSKLRGLTRKFEHLLSSHFEGNDLIHSLADWLYSFYTEILPLFQLQSFYYLYEDSELLDEDSQRVFLLFWQRYGARVTGLHAIFNGTTRPSLFQAASFFTITLGQKETKLYHSLLISQFGRAEDSLLFLLSEWMMEKQIEYHHCPMILDELIHTRGIQLTRNGWAATPTCKQVLAELDIHHLMDQRLNSLHEQELELLRVFACMPHPIRARTIFAANDLDDTHFFPMLRKLARSGLVLIFSEDSLFIPFDVTQRLLLDLPIGSKVAYYRKALPLLQKVGFISYPTLIEIARLAEESRTEYFYLIKYYRRIRNLLTVDRKRLLIEDIKQLQHKLQRTKIICWDRLLCQLYMRLNMYPQAEKVAKSIVKRTKSGIDRFVLMRIHLFTNQLDLAAVKEELLEFLLDPTQTLIEKVYATILLNYIDFFAPLHRENAEIIHRAYLNVFYPNRHRLSTRTFAELSINYTIVLFQYFPELEEWAAALLDKIESTLERTPHQDLMIELSNSFIFHSDIRLSRRYIQRCLDISKRYGFKGKEQISHLNGMEISLYQGDASSYRYHMLNVPQVDELRRKDLLEQYHTHQLLYSCEWEQWSQFDEIYVQLSKQQSTNFTNFIMEVYSRYSTYRQGKKLPSPCEWEQPNEYTLFIDGLYQAQTGNVDQACDYFRQSIAANGYRLQTGWSYREMVDLLLKHNRLEAEEELENFEEYLKNYGYDVFWPDLHRGYADLTMQKRDLQRSMLYLRRAANGYQLIEKDHRSKSLTVKLAEVVQPDYIPCDSVMRADPTVQRLMEERTQLLDQSLDLQIIIQLSEQVTESLELTNTFQKLSNSLFRYFPVTHTAISCNLFYQKETLFYSAIGLIDKNEQLVFQKSKQSKSQYEYMLYQQGDEFIKLNVYANDLADTKRLHMEHFLSFIKPHIANALHYMEMMIDNLTGFYQRRFFLRKLREEFEVSQRHGLDLSLIMIDIDNFRRVNEYGHQEGDKVLRELADMLRSLLRKNDIPGRFGGEELLLILPKTDGKVALQLAEQLRQQIEEEFAIGRPYQVTISAGVASSELCQAKNIEELIRFADNAEITAKTTGKNRVVAAWETLASLE